MSVHFKTKQWINTLKEQHNDWRKNTKTIIKTNIKKTNTTYGPMFQQSQFKFITIRQDNKPNQQPKYIHNEPEY